VQDLLKRFELDASNVEHVMLASTLAALLVPGILSKQDTDGIVTVALVSAVSHNMMYNPKVRPDTTGTIAREMRELTGVPNELSHLDFSDLPELDLGDEPEEQA
jgi:hypothetical protein